jgi:tetratricopeptide (TPR) repeat protein
MNSNTGLSRLFPLSLMHLLLEYLLLVNLRVGICWIATIATVLLPFTKALADELPPTPATRTTANVQQFYKAGMELVSQQRLDEAVQVFEQALRLDASNPTLLNAIGAVFNLKGNSTEAEGYFLKALRVDPKFFPARKNLAITYFESGKDSLANPRFEELSRDPKTMPVAFLFLGMIAEKRKQYDKAADLLKKSGDLVFHYPQAVVSFAYSLGRLHNSERAQALLDRLSVLPNVRGDDWLRAGVLYSEFGQYQRALDCYDKAQAFDPQLPTVAYRRAVALDKLGRSKEALEIVHQLSAEKPDVSSLRLLAHVAENAGELDLAIQSFRKAAEIEPGNEENYLDYSTLCMNYQNYPLALEVVDVGLVYVPNSYRLRVQRGAIRAELGKVAEAEEDFRAALALRTVDREALLCLAQVQAHDGHYDDSLQVLRTVTRKYPTDFYGHYYYAFVLFLKGGNNEKALWEVKRSLQLNSNFSKSYFLLGKMCLDRDPEFAAKQFQTSLRLDPQYVSAKYQLGRLLLRMGKREDGGKLLAEVTDQKLKEEEKEPILVEQR